MSLLILHRKSGGTMKSRMGLKGRIGEDFLRKLPKAELHCHLDGCVRPQTVLDLAREQGVELPTYDLAELSALVQAGPHTKSLEQYLEAFAVTLRVLQTPYAITRVMYEVCEDNVADGVKYLEVRFSPLLHRSESMSLTQVMEAACEGLVMAEYRLPIVARIIVCGIRSLSTADSESLAEVAWRYRSKGVVALDLAGPEYGFSSKDHMGAFYTTRRHLLSSTLHAGEADGPQSIRDAIRYCGAHRIGHGLALRDDAGLMAFVADRRIPVEVCITSNMQTKGISAWNEHPLRDFLQAGVICVPCTDNRSVSDVTLTHEYGVYVETFDLTPEELAVLVDNGFRSAFLDASQRNRLRSEAFAQILAVYREYDVDTTRLTCGNYFWDRLGVPSDACRLGQGPCSHSFWRGNGAKPLSRDLLRALPKVDLDCRLDGSVPLHRVWEELQKDHLLSSFSPEVQARLKEVPSAEAFAALVDKNSGGQGGGCSTCDGSGSSGGLSLYEVLRQVCNGALQSERQIREGMDAVLEEAQADGVWYMELFIRPSAHTAKGLTFDQVVGLVVDELARQRSKRPTLTVGLVLYSNPLKDTPIDFHRLCQRVVDLPRQEVCGVGLMGEDLTLGEREYHYFAASFDLLKQHDVNVVVFAGQTRPDTVLPALHHGGATRLSGVFSCHREPELMSYLANHQIPVEMGITDRFNVFTKDVRSFVGNPIRLFLDFHLVVTICSFKNALAGKSRTDVWESLTLECHLSPPELLQLLQHGFSRNFQSLADRREMASRAWEESVSLLRNAGFHDFFHSHYMP